MAFHTDAAPYAVVQSWVNSVPVPIGLLYYVHAQWPILTHTHTLYK